MQHHMRDETQRLLHIINTHGTRNAEYPQTDKGQYHAAHTGTYSHETISVPHIRPTDTAPRKDPEAKDNRPDTTATGLRENARHVTGGPGKVGNRPTQESTPPPQFCLLELGKQCRNSTLSAHGTQAQTCGHAIGRTRTGVEENLSGQAHDTLEYDGHCRIFPAMACDIDLIIQILIHAR